MHFRHPKGAALPFKYKGKTIFPTGTWVATYFSEELKEAKKYGYKFTLISGLEFSRFESLFDSYIDHFYAIKRNSTGPVRKNAKMMLNNLYGYFGRRTDTIETINIQNSELPKYLLTNVIKNIIEITEDTSVLLISKGFNNSTAYHLNTVFKSPDIYNSKPILANVAIASAVTAYARTFMMSVKDENTCYTDTDSIITTKPLPTELVGSDLGLFKDELDGNKIIKGYFLGIKRYGYIIKDPKTNQLIEKSVFSGVTRNSITFNEIEQIANGVEITKKIESKFIKSMKELSLKIRRLG